MNRTSMLTISVAVVWLAVLASLGMSAQDSGPGSTP